MPRARLRYVAVAAVASLAALSACSSGGTSSNAPASSKTSSSTSQLQQVVQAALQRPTSIGITTPVGKPIPKNKTIAALFCSIPSCTILNTYAQQAAAALGWKLVPINIGLTPETVKAGWDQAVALHPDAVISAGFAPTLFPSELATLASEHVPVIEGSIAYNTQPGGGLTAVYDGNAANQAAGKLQAQWVVSKWGTKANVLSIGVPTFPTITTVVDSFQSEYKKLCSSCTLGSISLSASDIGTPEVASAVTAYLQAHPGVNVIESSDSDVAIGLPAALQNAGQNPDIVLLDTSPTVSNYIAAGQVSVTTGVDWPTIIWQMFDTFARIFTNQSTSPDVDAPSPQWLITKSNIPSTSSYFPLVANYQDQFKKLWGLSS
ncbi:MAG TPA: sugar ABC transporter substrate-binding protein [Pseudonocardiaceae bacterium]|nr:sugar ABC transporter substrate-binding protein [Pseudonocardiaceae bacterium]